MSDAVTNYAGSWSFIFWFMLLSTVYMLYNIYSPNKFDLYFFPGLNLLLGFLSALTAPFMLMSGNRQSLKDRKKAAEDLATDQDTNKRVKELEKDLKEIKEMLRK